MSRRELLEWIAAVGAAGDDAVAVVAACSPRVARARLRACERAGLLRGTRLLTELPALYALTPAGRRAVGLATASPPRVTASNAAHLTWCARAAAVLTLRHRDLRVEGEGALRTREMAAQRPIVSAPLLAGGRVHRPDLVLWPLDGSAPIAIEVELTLKSTRRLESIVRAWARQAGVAAVVYYAPPAVAHTLEGVVESARAGDRVAVLPLASLGPRAPVPQAMTTGATEPSQARPNFVSS